MKKLSAIILIIVMFISLNACGNKAGNTVDITIPASFFTDMTKDDIETNSKEQGYTKFVINDDGSVTYTMTKEKRKEMLDDYKKELDKTIEDYVNGENKVSSFKSISYNEDISNIDIRVDSSQYSAWDSMYTLGFYMYGAYYQVFNGVRTDDIDVIVNFIDHNTDEILDTKSYREWMSNTSSGNDETEEEEHMTEHITTEEAPFIEVGENISISDICDFMVEFTDIADKILPPSPGSWYSYYTADNGKRYVDICVAYKNLDTSDIMADKAMSATLLFASKYKYTGFSVIEEDNRDDFTYSSITSIAPLTTGYLHYLFEIPDEVADSDGKLVVTLNISGNKYNLIIRDGAEGDVLAPYEDSVMKMSGLVKDKEKVAIEGNCEFWVDYSDITNDVIPPNPSDWYSHYKASDGKVYIDFCVAFRNWKPTSLMADEAISAKLTYATKYEYSGFSTIEKDNRGDFTYSNITSISPLCTEYIHYLFEVPEEVANSTEPINISFKVGGNEYSYTVR